MKRFLATVDRWGPALISVLALFVVCGIGWIYAERIAKLEGQVITLQDLNEDVQMWQAYTMVLSKRMLEHGIVIPDPPQPSQPKATNKNSQPNP